MDSYTVSWLVFIIAFSYQLYYFRANLYKLSKVEKFFEKEGEYSIFGEKEDSQLSTSVAKEDSHLSKLLKELNEYTRKNHGTTDFSVIQNKTDRKINNLYEEASSRLAFPTYIGLMGTFAGVFIGLLFFNSGLKSSVEGITDSNIASLISGVLVSMSTSFIGLFLTTITHNYAAKTRKIVGEKKNEFFEFIQNELMPTLGVSMVVALNKLHETINLFEPSFNRVIDRFQTTFDSCTQRFGDAFERNVVTVSDAVRVMGENMDKINKNVDLNERLIETMQSEDISRTLGVFIDASFSYGLIVDRTRKFEEMASLLEKKTMELIATQKLYNSSLEIPMSVANKLNAILSRVTDFEKSVNALGRSIEKSDIFVTAEVEALKQAVTAIKKKQKTAVEAMELSDGHLENIFKMQAESISKLGKAYEASLETYAEKFEKSLVDLEAEIKQRKREIVSAIEEKFSLEEIQHEFSQLHKLQEIEKHLDDLSKISASKETEKTLESTRREVSEIHKLLEKVIKDNDQRERETSQSPRQGGFFNSIFGRNN